ncbi:DinB family protein [Sinomonas sp. ASV486]|uniref:DinB family protein n=1 Tax=Sinomonas sp. ASV486 TaxID=3051170 RepID=UPI0027DCFAAD|nr:DinB family protein [Sinomonas sp. ASV486]MDQ4492191.1 DinB family protein [Sinomonas sp. ASV486]
MTGPSDPKDALRRYLQSTRDALVWKLEGLSERDLRLPRTPTGTSLLGIVKHAANVEIGYFGDVFGRSWPSPEERVSDEETDADPQADWFATENETAEGIVDLYRRVWAFADATVDTLPLDTVGCVPWWPEERAQVTLGQVMVHVLSDLARHAGHADILRESIDGAAGLRAGTGNLPDLDWPAYVQKLTELANRF